MRGRTDGSAAAPGAPGPARGGRRGRGSAGRRFTPDGTGGRPGREGPAPGVRPARIGGPPPDRGQPIPDGPGGRGRAPMAAAHRDRAAARAAPGPRRGRVRATARVPSGPPPGGPPTIGRSRWVRARTRARRRLASRPGGRAGPGPTLVAPAGRSRSRVDRPAPRRSPAGPSPRRPANERAAGPDYGSVRPDRPGGPRPSGPRPAGPRPEAHDRRVRREATRRAPVPAARRPGPGLAARLVSGRDRPARSCPSVHESTCSTPRPRSWSPGGARSRRRSSPDAGRACSSCPTSPGPRTAGPPRHEPAHPDRRGRRRDADRDRRLRRPPGHRARRWSPPLRRRRRDPGPSGRAR